MSVSDRNVSYVVVFLGDILTGFEKSQVLKNLVNITRLPENQVEKKFFSSEGGRVVIKKTTDLDKARRYHGKFLRAGIAVGIQMDFDESTES